MALAGRIRPASCLRLHLAEVRQLAQRSGEVERRHGHHSLSTSATSTLKAKVRKTAMESQASPEFSDYLHAIGRRKALLFGVAIPIAILAILLSVTLPDIYSSSGLVEIDDPSGAPTQSLGTLSTDNGESDYADQYVQNLK